MGTIDRRGIVRTPLCDTSLARIQVDYPRAEESLDGAEWSLARDPEKMGISIGEHTWQANIKASALMPAARIYYAFTRRILFVLNIELIDEN